MAEESRESNAKRSGGCRCGAVRFTVYGSPKRIGICHCTDCRQESGSAFTFFAVWPAEAFETRGVTSVHLGRRFCSVCGSRLFALTSEEAEVKLGTLDSAPTPLTPIYELWTKRREPWMSPVDGAQQFMEDRK